MVFVVWQMAMEDFEASVCLFVHVSESAGPVLLRRPESVSRKVVVLAHTRSTSGFSFGVHRSEHLARQISGRTSIFDTKLAVFVPPALRTVRHA